MDIINKKLIDTFMGKNRSIVFTSYDKDWNALMPVIIKIRDIIETENLVSLQYNEQRLNPYLYNIDTIVNGCIEFIKTYRNHGR